VDDIDRCTAQRHNPCLPRAESVREAEHHRHSRIQSGVQQNTRSIQLWRTSMTNLHPLQWVALSLLSFTALLTGPAKSLTPSSQYIESCGHQTLCPREVSKSPDQPQIHPSPIRLAQQYPHPPKNPYFHPDPNHHGVDRFGYFHDPIAPAGTVPYSPSIFTYYGEGGHVFFDPPPDISALPTARELMQRYNQDHPDPPSPH
jgi:hypothetical protein